MKSLCVAYHSPQSSDRFGELTASLHTQAPVTQPLPVSSSTCHWRRSQPCVDRCVLCAFRTTRRLVLSSWGWPWLGLNLQCCRCSTSALPCVDAAQALHNALWLCALVALLRRGAPRRVPLRLVAPPSADAGALLSSTARRGCPWRCAWQHSHWGGGRHRIHGSVSADCGRWRRRRRGRALAWVRYREWRPPAPPQRAARERVAWRVWRW